MKEDEGDATRLTDFHYVNASFAAFTLNFAVAFAGLAIVTLAAATQVWDYPKPRTDFGQLAGISAGLGILFWFASWAHFDLVERSGGKHFAKRAWAANALTVALCLTFIYASLHITSHRLADCLFWDEPVCTQKATTP